MIAHGQLVDRGFGRHQSLLGEHVAIERLDRFLARCPRTDAILHLLRHLVQQTGIGRHVQRRIGVAGDQKRPLLQIHALVRHGRQLNEFVFQLATTDLLEYRGDSLRHFWLFDLGFLQEGHG